MNYLVYRKQPSKINSKTNALAARFSILAYFFPRPGVYKFLIFCYALATSEEVLPEWWNGIHARLKIVWRKPYGFKSHLRHKMNEVKAVPEMAQLLRLAKAWRGLEKVASIL